MWADAFDAMNALDGRDDLTVDQMVGVAVAKALLSISQELSKIHSEGINPDFHE